MSEQFFDHKRRQQFLALQETLVPASIALSPKDREAGLQIIESVLARQAAANRKKMALFLNIIDLLSFLVGGSAFRNLNPTRKQRLLHWLFDAPIPLLRKGFWGINTLAKMGVYGLDSQVTTWGYVVRENVNG